MITNRIRIGRGRFPVGNVVSTAGLVGDSGITLPSNL